MSSLALVIGNKRYSSWSLRAWLAVKQTGEAFEEILVSLDRPDTHAQILARSPSGRVPALRHGDVVVWDSLAIVEYVAETFPAAKLWPGAKDARAVARSVSAEMHSGFAALRQAMPMNLRTKLPGRGRTPLSLADIDRVVAIWRDCRARFGKGGPFLFGGFTGADAMYAPVVTRFETYDVKVDEVCKAYMLAVLTHPPMVEWARAAAEETDVVAADEYPALEY